MTQYDATVADVTGDSVRVFLPQGGAQDPHLRITDTCGSRSVAFAQLTPATARELAKHLKRAANVAEGRPAVKPKPRVIVDGDGDEWHLSPNGKYGLFRVKPNASYSRRAIREEHGIREERP